MIKSEEGCITIKGSYNEISADLCMLLNEIYLHLSKETENYEVVKELFIDALNGKRLEDNKDYQEFKEEKQNEASNNT